MARPTRARVLGANELRDFLRDVMPEEGRKLVRDVVRGTAEKLASRLSARAPKGETLELSRKIRAKSLSQKGDQIRAAVVLSSDHWLFVEYGTVHMDAQPFIAPELEVMRVEAIEAFVEFGKEYERAVAAKAAAKLGRTKE